MKSSLAHNWLKSGNDNLNRSLREIMIATNGVVKASLTVKRGEICMPSLNLATDFSDSQQKYQDFSLTKKKCPKCGAFLKEKKVRDGKLLVCT